MPKICIVTPTYIASNPRAVKEADALSSAGFEVRVVASQGSLERIRQHDQLLLKEKSWRYQAVDWSPSHFLYYIAKYRQNFVRRLPAFLWQFGQLAAMGEGRIYPELARLAAAEKADLYIGHYPAGLAAAATAAQRWHTRYSYDVEDLHTAELSAHQQGGQKRIQWIEQRYLPDCAYITTASDLLAYAMQQRYPIAKPKAIYNVFPRAERTQMDGQIKDRCGEALSLYWYSQTVGLNRGIQDAVRALALIRSDVQLHLRGTTSEEVQSALQNLAGEHRTNLFFHPQVPPSELLSRAVEHDIGLALEQPVDTSRELSVTNKLFFYFLAGLCVAVTDVPGQRQIMNTVPEAGFIYPVGDYPQLAQKINALIEQPALLHKHKQAALLAAQEQWNWEKESQKLIDLVREAIT